ncbi:hypothetical protein MPNTM1_03946 [Mycolicibacterium parafortuitum]|uniref:PE-PPE domain-containing protein n=1 Tax=Mycolicibacterium parafortuitum TaxID=39692 RepID=UPI0032C433D9
MRVTFRNAVGTVSALVLAAAVILLATSPSVFTIVALASTTALIMGGTGHPLSTPPDTVPYVRKYLDEAVNNYISPASTAANQSGITPEPYNGVALITPAEGAPNYGTMTVRESVSAGLAALDRCITSQVCDYNQDVGSLPPSLSDPFVVFGYSQSAVIALLEKARLADEFAVGEGPDVSFVVIAGPRPNGGLTARDTTGVVIPLLLGVKRDELITEPVRTDTQYSTVDIAIQYDGLVDFPLNPLNLLAVMNAYAGMVALHSAYSEHMLSDAAVLNQGQYGDTRYYLIPSNVLPLLKPIEDIPVIGRILADSWDPVLRVIVESAYDRGTSPGQPTPFDVLYKEDPIRFIQSILIAIPTGLDNGFETIFGVRPLGTDRPGAYGVGGWDAGPATESAIAGNETRLALATLPTKGTEEHSARSTSAESSLTSTDSVAADIGNTVPDSADSMSDDSPSEDSDSAATDLPDDSASVDLSPGDIDTSSGDPASESATEADSVGSSSAESSESGLPRSKKGDRGARGGESQSDKPSMATSSSS